MCSLFLLIRVPSSAYYSCELRRKTRAKFARSPGEADSPVGPFVPLGGPLWIMSTEWITRELSRALGIVPFIVDTMGERMLVQLP